MKTIRVKSISFLLALCLIFTASAVPVAAAEASPALGTASTAGIERTIWPSTATFYGVKCGVAGTSIDVKITYDTRDEASNSSGYYLTGVRGAEVVGKSGWLAVRRVTVSSVSYANNHQSAAVRISFEASIGSGYAPYSALVTIESLNGDNFYYL